MNKNLHIVLVGDSVFDNERYVLDGNSVESLLRKAMPAAKTSLLAWDGAICNDIIDQLEYLPTEVSHLIVSCGGNDALESLPLLEIKVKNVEQALKKLAKVSTEFRRNYIKMLTLIGQYKDPIVCTIYNKCPGLSVASVTALSIFNDIILEEAMKRGLDIIDLRTVCTKTNDFSLISPIEPSKQGGEKIVKQIIKRCL
jgi:hypothetical protein